MLIKGVSETKRAWEGKEREFNFRCCFSELTTKSHFPELLADILWNFVLPTPPQKKKLQLKVWSIENQFSENFSQRRTC